MVCLDLTLLNFFRKKIHFSQLFRTTTTIMNTHKKAPLEESHRQHAQIMIHRWITTVMIFTPRKAWVVLKQVITFVLFAVNWMRRIVNSGKVWNKNFLVH